MLHAVIPYAVVAVLAVVLPLLSPFERRFYRSNLAGARKLSAYGLIVILAWGLTGAVIGLYGWSALLNGRISTAWLPMPAILRPMLGLFLAAYYALAFTPLVQSLRGARWRRAYAAAIRREAAGAGYQGILPDTAAQRVGFVFVCLTAGICEEILFRGFLIRFLHQGALALPLGGALLASAVIFGLNHLYQGLKGGLTTALGGVSFGLLFLLTGSLVPPMILHALVDLQLVFVLWPAVVEGEAERARGGSRLGGKLGLRRCRVVGRWDHSTTACIDDRDFETRGRSGEERHWRRL